MTDDTNAKGARNERRAKRILDRAYKTSRVREFTNHDPFGLVDLIGLRHDQRVKFVQVKTNRFSDRDRYARQAAHYLPTGHVEFEVWVREDYYGWRMYRFDPDTESFTQYADIDTCDYDEIVAQWRDAIGFHDWDHP